MLLPSPPGAGHIRANQHERRFWHLIRSLAVVVVVAAALAAAPGAAFPWKPIEFTVHTAPGGVEPTCMHARSVTSWAARRSSAAAVSYPTAGGGAMAFDDVKAKKEAIRTWSSIASGSFLAAANRKELDLGLENFTPIAAFALDPQAVAVAADSKFKTIKDLIEAGRKEPNVLTAGISSATGTGRLLLYLVERGTSTKFRYVSFKSGSEAAVGGRQHVGDARLVEFVLGDVEHRFQCPTSGPWRVSGQVHLMLVDHGFGRCSPGARRAASDHLSSRGRRR